MTPDRAWADDASSHDMKPIASSRLFGSQAHPIFWVGDLKMLKSCDLQISENRNVVLKWMSAVFSHNNKLQQLGNNLLSLYTALKLPLPQFNRYVFGIFYEITYIEPLLQLKFRLFM